MQRSWSEGNFPQFNISGHGYPRLAMRASQSLFTSRQSDRQGQMGWSRHTGENNEQRNNWVLALHLDVWSDVHEAASRWTSARVLCSSRLGIRIFKYPMPRQRLIVCGISTHFAFGFLKPLSSGSSLLSLNHLYDFDSSYLLEFPELCSLVDDVRFVPDVTETSRTTRARPKNNIHRGSIADVSKKTGLRHQPRTSRVSQTIDDNDQRTSVFWCRQRAVKSSSDVTWRWECVYVGAVLDYDFNETVARSPSSDEEQTWKHERPSVTRHVDGLTPGVLCIRPSPAAVSASRSPSDLLCPSVYLRLLFLFHWDRS